MLKQPGWTTCSKSKKLMGLSAKNWAWLELLLNYMDCRLKSKEPRDSLANMPGRTGTRDLILDVQNRSGGSSVLRAQSGGGTRQGWRSHGGAARDSPKLGVLGCPGSNSAGFGSESIYA